MIHITVTDREIKWTAVLIAFLLLASGAFGQQAPAPAPAKYVPTEVQHLRLENAQLRAINSQQQMTVACGSPGQPGELAKDFSAKLQALGDEAAKVRKENNWPETVVFNNQTLTYGEQAPAQPPAPPAKADPPADKKP